MSIDAIGARSHRIENSMCEVESCEGSVDCAGFKLLIEISWRETLAFKTNEQRGQKRKQSIQYVHINFELQFLNKINFIPKLGGMC